jgi:hypothetical protein
VRIRRLTGRVAGAVAVLAALSGLTGCGPAGKPVVAVSYIGGAPTALLVHCSRFKIDIINVSDVTTASATGTWSVQGPEDSEPPQITFFQAPPGWTVTKQTLTSFDEHRKYAAQPFSSRGDPATTVAFSITQLKSLKPNQVLISKGVNESKAVSETKFRKDAKAAC